MRKWILCIHFPGVNLKRRNEPLVMWNSHEYPAEWTDKIFWLICFVTFSFCPKNSTNSLCCLSWHICKMNFFLTVICVFRSFYLFVSLFFFLTCVLMSRTSNIKDWVSPPLKPSKHRMPNDVIEMFVIVQLWTWYKYIIYNTFDENFTTLQIQLFGCRGMTYFITWSGRPLSKMKLRQLGKQIISNNNENIIWFNFHSI